MKTAVEIFAEKSKCNVQCKIKSFLRPLEAFFFRVLVSEKCFHCEQLTSGENE